MGLNTCFIQLNRGRDRSRITFCLLHGIVSVLNKSMKNLNKVLFLWILLGFSIIAWVVLALVSFVPFSDALKMLKLIPKVVTVDAIALAVFVKWLWKWKPLQGWLVPFPN